MPNKSMWPHCILNGWRLTLITKWVWAYGVLLVRKSSIRSKSSVWALLIETTKIVANVLLLLLFLSLELLKLLEIGLKLLPLPWPRTWANKALVWVSNMHLQSLDFEHNLILVDWRLHHRNVSKMVKPQTESQDYCFDPTYLHTLFISEAHCK
jgi:hypothetical protein